MSGPTGRARRPRGRREEVSAVERAGDHHDKLRSLSESAQAGSQSARTLGGSQPGTEVCAWRQVYRIPL